MAVTHYVWDPVFDYVIEELDDAGNIIAEYTHEPKLHGALISQHRNGVSSFYHYDAIGSTRALTDMNQIVTDTAAYSAFGEVIDSTGVTPNPFKYCGSSGYYSAPNLDTIYVRSRYYLPDIARWLSADPLGLLGGRNLHLYEYAENSPTIWIDSSGLLACSPVNGSSDCVGACIEGQNVKIAKCEFSKVEVLPGSDRLCNVITSARICLEMGKWFDRENAKSKDKKWLLKKCAAVTGCDCGKLTEMSGKGKTITLKDEVIESTGPVDTPIYKGDLHCILKLSGEIVIDSDYFAWGKCVASKK